MEDKNKIFIKKVFVTEDGEVYLRLQDSGIPTISILMDGITVCYFNEDRNKIHVSAREVLKFYTSQLPLYKTEQEKLSVINENISFLKRLMIKYDPGLKHNGEIFEKIITEQLKYEQENKGV